MNYIFLNRFFGTKMCLLLVKGKIFWEKKNSILAGKYFTESINGGYRSKFGRGLDNWNMFP